MKGRRILHLEMGKVVLKDLLAYIPTNLASLPKTFKFEDKVLKGFFPHKLSNVVDNCFESEVWPDEKFYEPAKLRSDAERAELRAFLAAKAGQKFNFMEECLLYCSDDVLILALAVLALERTTLSETAFHISFVHSSTFTVAGLASICYRHLFMRPKSIGLFPVHGYANLTNVQSLAAEIYFRWLNEGRRREGKEEIRYSKSSIYGEHKMANLRVDGVTSTEMWEYDSCFHHASPCCYQGRMTQKHPLYKIPYSQVHYMDIVGGGGGALGGRGGGRGRPAPPGRPRLPLQTSGERPQLPLPTPRPGLFPTGLGHSPGLGEGAGRGVLWRPTSLPLHRHRLHCSLFRPRRRSLLNNLFNRNYLFEKICWNRIHCF